MATGLQRMLAERKLPLESGSSADSEWPVQIRPLPLRRVARESVRYINQICLRRSSLALDWLSKQWTMALYSISAPMLAFAEEATVDWGGAKVRFRVGEALLETGIREVLQVESMGPVEGEVRAVLVEAAFAGLATAIETHTRKRFRLIQTFSEAEQSSHQTAVSAGVEGLHGFSVVMNDGDVEYICEAWLDDLALGFLANALRDWKVQVAPTELWSHLPLKFQLSAGWTTLSLGTIRRLGVNDVILLDECLVGGEEDLILIRLGERFGVRGKLTGSTITITDWLDEIMDDTDDFDDFDEINDDEVERSSGQEEGDELDKLPVRLNFDLGDRLMTLAELRSLSPGYVIELGRDVRRSVAIRVNGRTIGEGELVEIDGYMGVSLLSIHPPSA